MEREVVIIAARCGDGAIGRAGRLPCHLPADLRRFKALTLGHPVVMGRKTFESLPGGALPGRRNIVVTRSGAYSAPGVETAPSLPEALALAATDATDVYILGGGQIYAQALPMAQRLELTELDMTMADADTYFPAVDEAEWDETFAEHHPAADGRPAFTFRTLKRKKSR